MYTKTNLEVTRQGIKLYGYTNLRYYIQICIQKAYYFVKYGTDSIKKVLL